ncbi:hypothetical protein MFP26_01925 [Brenneria sp. MC1SB4.1]|uniref:Uncharacterized protein n=1 Tax=Brenneria tiliae TaxID=2914984 RepID=A0ABT0MNT8_9GAMM|nr:hypothetical protein [Brenneria tiliae]
MVIRLKDNDNDYYKGCMIGVTECAPQGIYTAGINNEGAETSPASGKKTPGEPGERKKNH